MRGLNVRYRALRKKITMWLKTNQELKEKGVIASLHRIYWSAPFMALGSLLIAFLFSRKQEVPFSVEEQWRSWIVVAHSSMAVVTSGFWLVAGKLKRAKVHYRTLALFLYVVVIYVLGMGIWVTTLDQLVTSSITPFLISSTMVGALYFIRPGISALIFAGSFMAFHICIGRHTELPITILDSSLSNALFASALGLALSVLNWRVFRINKLQEAKIEEQQDVLERMAYQDPLTNLPNRRLLNELVRREISLVQRGKIESSLIIIDLDSFKLVNDNYGHPVGDRVLQQFAHLLQKNIRGSSTLVRLGGEEFVILASNTNVAEAQILAERLRKLVEEYEFSVDNHRIHVTASFGVAPLLGTEEPNNYYTLADQALYRAKQQGKNRVVL